MWVREGRYSEKNDDRKKTRGTEKSEKKTTKLQKEILIISRVLLFKNSASCTLL